MWHQRRDGGMLNLNFVIQFFREGDTLHFQIRTSVEDFQADVEVFDKFDTVNEAANTFAKLVLVLKNSQRG